MVLLLVLSTLTMAGPPGDAGAQARPEGEIRWALYVTLWTVNADQRTYEFKLREGSSSTTAIRSRART